MHLIKVGKDQEVLATIGRAVAALGVTDGAITLVGAVHEARVSVMRKSDALDDLIRDYAQPFELTGTGEITGGTVHLHATLAGEDLVVAGHLHAATVREFFVHAYVTPLWTSGGSAMPKLRVHNVATSLDGFAAGPAQDIEHPLGVGGERLHEWIFETRYGRAMIGREGGTEGLDDAFLRRGDDNIGATVMGRNMFGPIRGDWGDEWSGWWGDEPPYHHDVFVLTHHPRADLVMKGGTRFRFVTDGLDSALRRAFAAAGGKDVRLGGGVATIRAALTAGLVDELHVAVAPILLGAGEPLFAGNAAAAYQVTEFTSSDRVTHYVLTKSA